MKDLEARWDSKTVDLSCFCGSGVEDIEKYEEVILKCNSLCVVSPLFEQNLGSILGTFMCLRSFTCHLWQSRRPTLQQMEM